jgi:hypothetical protein
VKEVEKRLTASLEIRLFENKQKLFAQIVVPNCTNGNLS